MHTFLRDNTFEQRLAESSRILAKYHDRLPVIVEIAENCELPSIDKHKYLLPDGITLGQFVYVIRKRLKLSPEHAIMVFVDTTIPKTSSLMSDIYNEHKAIDGFLYITFTGENTFGYN
jgi:GABA(A) receptor-associated protein